MHAQVLKFWRVTSESSKESFYRHSMQRHVMHAVGRALTQQLAEAKREEGDENNSDSGNSATNTVNSDASFTQLGAPPKGASAEKKRGGSVTFCEALPAHEAATALAALSPPREGSEQREPSSVTSSSMGFLGFISGRLTKSSDNEVQA